MQRLAASGFILAAGLCAACSLIPTNAAAPPPAPTDFPSVAPAPDLFAGPAPQEVTTPTKFEPQFAMSLASLKAGDAPAVSTSVYQTKGELEIKETDTLIGDTGFAFDKLAVGQQVGTGTMAIGTPPKLTLNVSMQVLSTNQQDTAMISVKASNPIAQVYIADMLIRKLPGGLSIIALGNETRADDVNGVHTTEASAKVTEDFAPGFFLLPSQPGVVQTRTIFVSEPDPQNQVTARKVFDASETVTP